MNSSVLVIEQAETISEPQAEVKALVVESSKMDQMILKKILNENDFDTCIVSDATSAKEKFIEYRPNVVYMNLNIPDASPEELTAFIKQQSNEKYIPVIYVTSINDVTILSKCLAAGGDDFINKPINAELLKAKTESLLRIKKMHDDLLYEKNILSGYIDTQIKDLHDADNVIHNVHKARYYDPGNLEWGYTAKNILSGDVLCSAMTPAGNHMVLVGDNTGHGLPAVTGSLITLDVFHALVDKGFDLQVILEEINNKLYNLLPSDRFLAACALEFDENYRSVKIWNAGLPSVLICNREGDVKEEMASVHLPLGIIKENDKNIIPVMVNLEEGDRLYAYTDGLTETFNDVGEMYGQTNLIKAIKRNSNQEGRVISILTDVKTFSNNVPQTDDVLLIEICCDILKIRKKVNQAINNTQTKPMNWRIKFELKDEALKNTNPIPPLVEALVEMQDFGDHRSKVFLILTEMYSNALEHGLLGMDSSIKNNQNGFVEYYELRQRKLNELNNAKLTLDVNHYVEAEKGVISICLENNGTGFNFDDTLAGLVCNSTNNGRGICLLQNLCRKCEYNDEGRKLFVEYEWQ